MRRPKLRKKHVRVDKSKVMQLIALGFDKKRVLKETYISERSYYNVRAEFDALSENRKAKILEIAKKGAEERVFDKNHWFRWDCLHHKGESQIPIIQKWYEILIMRDVKENSILRRMRSFRDICYGVTGRGKDKRRLRPKRIAPQNFTEQDGIDWIVLLKKEHILDQEHRLVIRNFLKYGKGVEPQRISGKKGASYGKMAREYLRDEEVEAVYYQIDQLPSPKRQMIKAIVAFMHRTATRVRATLRLKYIDFEEFKFNGITIMRVRVFDKGRKGSEEWNKMMLPIIADHMREYLDFAKAQGWKKPFPTNHWDLTLELRQIYEKALPHRRVHQPLHVWRHTFAMHYLRETGWNYELVATLGGWKSIEVLKECYGRPEERDVAQFIMERYIRGYPYARKHEVIQSAPARAPPLFLSVHP